MRILVVLTLAILFGSTVAFAQISSPIDPASGVVEGTVQDVELVKDSTYKLTLSVENVLTFVTREGEVDLSQSSIKVTDQIEVYYIDREAVMRLSGAITDVHYQQLKFSDDQTVQSTLMSEGDRIKVLVYENLPDDDFVAQVYLFTCGEDLVENPDLCQSATKSNNYYFPLLIIVILAVIFLFYYFRSRKITKKDNQ